MTEEKERPIKVSRRDFVKGAAAVAGAGALASCAPAATPVPTTAPEPAPTCPPAEECAPCPTPEPAAPTGYSFEVAPDPIPASDIKETVTLDVVVLGAGVGGMVAALSAAEAGARAVVLEKGATYLGHGGWNGVIGSRLQRELGIEIDKEEVIANLMRWAGYRNDQRLVRLWAEKSGEVMDWLLDMADAAGIEVIVETDVPSQGCSVRYSTVNQYPTAHLFMPALQMTLSPLLEGNAIAKGVEFNYETPAVQLVRGNGGRVTGVIAQTAEGDYKQFNASKGVVVCTGGYGCNPEMLKAYIGFRGERILGSGYTPPYETGDGIKMGLWVGAAIDEPPHCPMLFDVGLVDQREPLPGLLKLPRQPWLNVNVLGERYVNEDQWYGYTCNADQLQPGGIKWVVWDDKWEDEIAAHFGTVCERMVPSDGAPHPSVLGDQWALVDAALEQGIIKKADTIEELAQIMDVPVETFQVTVARYSELARNGKDEDFGKNPEKMTTIEQAPFYACRMGPVILVTLSGLKINTNMQVLDTEGKVIPGLYAAGNASGGFFANDYPIDVIGVSHGRALTFGRIAGQNVAGEAV